MAQPVAGANRRCRGQFRYRGSRRESAVAQLFSSLGHLFTAMQTPSSIPPSVPPPLNALPPVLPKNAGEDLGRYLDFASIICFLGGGIIGLGSAIYGVETAKQSPEDLFAVLVLAGWVISSILGGVLLRKRKKAGYPLAMICFVCMLLGICIGTILGVLGIIWLNKGKHLLK